MAEGDPRGRADAVVDPGFWEDVLAAGFAVPADRRLDDMTVELVELLGAVDPHLRDELALRVLCAWIAAGVYDDLLPALGDGLSDGLRPGLGEDGTLSVLRRSFSARALAAVVDRDNCRRGMHPEAVLGWGDRGLSWLVAERDLRGHIPGAGRAHALVHGAELVRALVGSAHLGEGALMVVLDMLADRLLTPTAHLFASREDDRLAYAAMTLLHREVVDIALLTGWVERLAAAWAGVGERGEPVPAQALNALSFVRALHLQLLLGVRPPDGVPAAAPTVALEQRPGVRVELLGVLQSALRTAGPYAERGPRAGLA